MSNVRPGMLAICVHPTYNNGRIFEVLEKAHEATKITGMLCWMLKPVGGDASYVSYYSRDTGMAHLGVGPDKYLRPLPGDDENKVDELAVSKTREGVETP